MRNAQLQILFAVVAAMPLFCQTTATYSYAGPPLPVVFSADAATVAEITVPQALAAQRVTVQVQIDYEQVADLNVFLFSPFGTRTKLLERNCGTLRNVDTTFDDNAESAFSSFCPTEPGRGPFRPNQPLANSVGETSLGKWRLAVQNNGSPGRRGTLRSFSITITGTPQTEPIITPDTIVDAASLRGSYVAPGEVVAIFGANLGPLTPATAPAGNLPLTLGGTTVIVDGLRAPIFYASRQHVEVQIPYAEIPGTRALIQVLFSGQASPIISIPVRTVAPGLFTTSPGASAAKAVNQNGTVNSTANPAPRGSIVSLFASGLGDTNLFLAAGVAAPLDPLIRTFYSIAAFVGGVSAPVQFAGLAPGFVGLHQVNILVPPDATPGTTGVVLVGVNGATSQINATIELQ